MVTVLSMFCRCGFIRTRFVVSIDPYNLAGNA